MGKSSNWGGRREGAGRKPKDKSGNAPQGRRDNLSGRQEFMPGNGFRHPSGRPNRHTSGEMCSLIAEYLERCEESGKVATWPGLALHLGLSRQSLLAYRNGETGRSPEERADYASVLEQVGLYMEDVLEGKLQRERGQVQGLIYALGNRFSQDWRQHQHEGVADLKVVIDLTRANELPPPIEAEVIQGEKHGE